MPRPVSVLLAASFVGLSPLASAQESAPLPSPAPSLAPPTGTSWIVVGSLAVAGGVGNLASAPLCRLSVIRASAQGSCVGMSIGFGVGLLGLGVPLVIVGAAKRKAWKAWGERVTVGAVPCGAMTMFSGTW